MQVRAHMIVLGVSFITWTAASQAQDKAVGDQMVSQEDMIVVQIHCNDLLKAVPTDPTTPVTSDFTASGGSTGPEGGQVGGDPAGSTAVPIATDGSGGSGGTIGAEDAPSVDLAAITLEDCRAAGLIR